MVSFVHASSAGVFETALTSCEHVSWAQPKREHEQLTHWRALGHVRPGGGGANTGLDGELVVGGATQRGTRGRREHVGSKDYSTARQCKTMQDNAIGGKERWRRRSMQSCDEMTTKGDSLGGLRVWGTRSFAETKLVPPVSASELEPAPLRCNLCLSTALMAGGDWLEPACACRARILAASPTPEIIFWDARDRGQTERSLPLTAVQKTVPPLLSQYAPCPAPGPHAARP
jgi:hypothetical protein